MLQANLSEWLFIFQCQVPFSFVLSSEDIDNRGRIYETYHGGNISIQVRYFNIRI